MFINPARQKKLKCHEWRVFTNHKETQQAIAARLAEQDRLEDSTTEIFHDGKKLPVFIVDFVIVEFLANNRYSMPYQFTAYHRKNDREPWARWMEEVKTPNEKIRRENKKRSIQRGVMGFRQRYS